MSQKLHNKFQECVKKIFNGYFVYLLIVLFILGISDFYNLFSMAGLLRRNVGIVKTGSNFILFMTFVVILGYTYETYRLRKEEQKQTNFEMRPYLRLKWRNRKIIARALCDEENGKPDRPRPVQMTAILLNGFSKSFTGMAIVNDGRGLAKGIEFVVCLKKNEPFLRAMLKLKGCETIRSVGGPTQLKYSEFSKFVEKEKSKIKKIEQDIKQEVKEKNILSGAYQKKAPNIELKLVICKYRDIENNPYIATFEMDFGVDDGFKVNFQERVSEEKFKNYLNHYKKTKPCIGPI